MHNNMNVNVSGPVQPASTYKTYVLKGQVPFATQVTETNAKYVIKYNFDLGGESVTIPEGCLLEFDGGAIFNGTLVGQSTILIYNQPLNDILTATLEGTWRHESGVKADEEDITDINGELKLKNRETANGMGKIILRKNKTFAEQLTQENTIYVIRYDFELTEDIVIPDSCVLQFDGGSINNTNGNEYSFNLNNAYIFGKANFDNVELLNNFKRQDIEYKPCFCIEDFGGKANDSSYDNSPALEAAINTANRLGGIVKFEVGEYYFSTPINISGRLANVTIEGSSWGVNIDSKITGTTLRWNGTGWFITFNNNVHKCLFHDFTLVCNENNGIKIAGNAYLSTIDRININGFINGLQIVDSAYLTIKMCQISSSSINVENNIILGSENGGNNIEFLYMFNCVFQNDDQHGNGIMIYSGRHIYIKECDIVQMNRGIYFDVKGLARWNNIRDTDIAYCNCSLDILLEDSSMWHFKFENISIIPNTVFTENDRIIRIKRSKGGIDLSGSVIDVNLDAVGDTPTNILDTQNYILGTNTKFIVKGSGHSNGEAYTHVLVGDGAITSIINKHYECICAMVKGNNSATTLSIPIGSDLFENLEYPNTIPCIVQDVDDNIASHSISRNNGQLYCDITFKQAFSNRNYITIYCPQVFLVRKITSMS